LSVSSFYKVCFAGSNRPALWTVEWDRWDAREFHHPLTVFGWMDCMYTNVLVCNQAQLTGLDLTYVNPSVDRPLSRVLLDAKTDYFLDLRDDPIQAKVVALTTDMLIQGYNTLDTYINNDNKTNAAIGASIKKFVGRKNYKAIAFENVKKFARKISSYFWFSMYILKNSAQVKLEFWVCC